jgi:hypothetical protein
MSMMPSKNEPVPAAPVNPDPLGLGPAPVVTSNKQQALPREVSGLAPDLVGKTKLGQQTGPGKYLYPGNFLADSKGIVYRAAYDMQNDPIIELTKNLNTTERLALLTELYQRDVYDGKTKPSENGLAPADIKAMQDFLTTANTYGYDWQTSLNFFRQDFPIKNAGGSGRKATSAVDLGKALQDESFATLGRKLTKEELQRAIRSVQSQEVSTTTSTSTLVDMAPQQVDPTQAQAYGFTRAADIVSQMLRNGG